VCLPDGTWRVTWTLSSTGIGVDGTVTNVGLTTPGTTVTNIVPGATLPHAGQLVGVQIMPGDAPGGDINVTVTWPVLEGTISRTRDGAVRFETPCTPRYTVAQDCAGITFTFTAPPATTTAALPSVEVNLHPSVGADVDFVLAPGADPKIVTFPGSAGLTVLVTIDEDFEKSHAWTQEPCPPSPSPSLAQTGSSLGTPIGLGAGLVLVGVALVLGALFLFRRRRTVAGD
jgi:hypothetical protein